MLMLMYSPFLAHLLVSYYNHERPVSVSGARFATAGSIMLYVKAISPVFFIFAIWPILSEIHSILKKGWFQPRGIKCFQAAHFWNLHPQRWKKVSIIVQILSPGGARGDFMFYPQLKNHQMMSLKSRPIIQPICSAVLCLPWHY
jgi:hypothetical protein